MTNGRALLLNIDYTPLGIISDRDAVLHYMKGTATVVEYSGEVFRSPSTTVMVPSVLRLTQYVDMPVEQRSIVMTKRTVCSRDGFICVYCDGVAATMDHIVPSSRGGKNVWTNVIAACSKCNGRKRDRLLSELTGQCVHCGKAEEYCQGHDFTPWPSEEETLAKAFRPEGVSAQLIKWRIRPEWEQYLNVAADESLDAVS